MRLSETFTIAGIFLLAGIGAYVSASRAADFIEARSEIDVRDVLDDTGYGWSEVQSDGLQVVLTGTAPDEATRFAALSAVGTVVDAARVIDRMEVVSTTANLAPRFSIELLRNDTGLSMIGLIPGSEDRDALADAISRIAGDLPVTDLLEVADYPAPDGWPGAVDFGLSAVESLGRSKVSISADRIAIVAAADSREEKARLETVFARRAPDGLRLALDISAPRPVITPFTLRFVMDGDGPRFDACAADTPAMRDQILQAAHNAGLEGKAECPLGLGMPTPKWGDASATAIAAVAELGLGTLTFSDTDVSLIAPAEISQDLFDRIVGGLETDLPDIFSLTAVRLEPETSEAEGPPEFVATRSPEGLVQLRGRLPSDLVREATESYAVARFGRGSVYMGARVAEGLPNDWSVRVLAGLDALSEVSNGAIVVQENFVEVRGDTGNVNSRANISRLLSEKLGDGANFEIAVRYREELDAQALIPSPEECLQQIDGVLAQKKITFEPGSTEIDAAGMQTIGRIADILRVCENARVEIGGHTDSQGREELNQRISQERADAVRAALIDRRILRTRLEAIGYGESQPIADNETEDGREANRRIVFSLIVPQPIEEVPTTLEEAEMPLEETEAPAADETPDEQN